VRPFPRTFSRRLPSRLLPPSRRRLAGALVVGLLAAGLTAGVVPGVGPARADDLKDKQARVKRDLKAAHGDLEESSARAHRTAKALEAAQARLVTARGELASAQGRVAAAKLRDQELQSKLDQAVAKLAQARTDLATGQEAVVDQRGDVQSLIVDFYTGGDPRLNALSGILTSKTPSELISTLENQDVMVSTQSDAYDSLRAAEVLLEVRAQQVRDAKRETAERRREAARQLELTKQAEAAAQQAELAVEGRVADSRSAKSAADSARRADLQKLKQLEAEQAKIEKLLAQQAAAAAAAKNPSGPTGGYLSYPTSGAITSPFGWRIHPIYHYWGLHDGVDFGAACGSPLRAAAPGRVLSSYWSTVYGNRMVIGHGIVRGVSLATIYNHATSYTVSVGQQVQRGQVIGYVGSTGWSTGCHLHFTVMVNGKAVDPMGWF
jgi:murein DD-endopeptidase MepM/ murein hydrolase activator NlpD